jgi:hypothetical protein
VGLGQSDADHLGQVAHLLVEVLVSSLDRVVELAEQLR